MTIWTKHSNPLQRCNWYGSCRDREKVIQWQLHEKISSILQGRLQFQTERFEQSGASLAALPLYLFSIKNTKNGLNILTEISMKKQLISFKMFNIVSTEK